MYKIEPNSCQCQSQDISICFYKINYLELKLNMLARCKSRVIYLGSPSSQALIIYEMDLKSFWKILILPISIFSSLLSRRLSSSIPIHLAMRWVFLMFIWRFLWKLFPCHSIWFHFLLKKVCYALWMLIWYQNVSSVTGIPLLTPHHDS